MDRTKQLAEEPVGKLLLSFSIPAIVGMVVNALYNVVDRIFVGRGVGTLGIAGVTAGFPLMILSMAMGMLFSVGATSLISIRLGEGKKDDAEHIAGNCVVLLTGVSLLITAGGLLFLTPLLRLFGISEQALPYGRDFQSIILLGVIFMNISFGMNNFIRAEGNPRTAMATQLIGAVLNVIFCPIFISVFGWGIKGSAFATVLAQGISATWVVCYFIFGRSTLKLGRRHFVLTWKNVKAIMAIGFAPFAMQVAASFLYVLYNHSIARYGGDTALSALGIIGSIAMLILMPIFGINQGAQPIIGFNYGARQLERVKSTLKIAIVAGSCVVCAGYVIIQAWPEAIVRLFVTKDEELVALGSHLMRLFLAMMPLIGFQIVSSGYFQAVGKPKEATILSLSRQVLILIPALLILPRFYGLDGVFMASPTADFLSSVLTGVCLYLEIKKLGAPREGRGSPAEPPERVPSHPGE